MKKRNFINSLLQHTRRPDGFLGRMMLRGMNNGHAPLTRWGAAHIEWQPQWCVLDIGCGGGATLLRLLERCPDGMVCGVDASPESVEFSRRKPRDMPTGAAWNRPRPTTCLTATGHSMP